MPRYTYDLEVLPNYFLGGFYNIDTGITEWYELGDNLINNIIHNPDVILYGFNNHWYDDTLLNYIGSNSIVTTGFFAGNPITHDDIYQMSCRIIGASWDNMPQDIKHLMFWDKVYKSIDLKTVMDPLPGLKKLQVRMNYRNVQDMPIAYDQCISTSEEKQTILTYCDNDINSTEKLRTDHAMAHVELRQFLVDMFQLPQAQKALSMSEPKIAEHILVSEYCKRTGMSRWDLRDKARVIPEFIPLDECIPNWIRFSNPILQAVHNNLMEMSLKLKSTGYVIGDPVKQTIELGGVTYQMGIGGLHSQDAPGIFESTKDIVLQDSDVTSYYPSIVLHDGIYPKAFGPLWNHIYREVYDARLAAKTEGRTTEANALKIVLNATFGKTSNQYSPLYDPSIFLHITLTGQLAILMLIERCLEAGIEVISGNTDGILIRRSTNQEKEYERICQQWEQDTGMSLEHTMYRKYIRRDVNNYVALKTDNKVKSKGVFGDADLKHDAKAVVVRNMAIAYLLHGITPAQYISENREELTIYDFMYSFSGTKAFRIYTIDQSGEETPRSKTNRWYISTDKSVNIKKFGGKNETHNQIPDGKGIRLMNLVTDESLPDDLDIEYYIKAANKLIHSCKERTDGNKKRDDMPGVL